MNNLLNKGKINLIPEYCPSCGSVLIVRGVHLICDNSHCFEKNIQVISNWVEKNNMDQVSESTVRALYDNKLIKNIIDLYHLKKEDINLNGFGEKKIDNLIAQIEKSKNTDIVKVLSRLSIPLIGEKAVVKMGIKTEKDFWNFADDSFVIGKNLIIYRIENAIFLKELFKVLNIQDVKVKGKSKGKVCMTGAGHKGRKELQKEIEDMGYEFTDSLSKDTDILICEDENGDSSKLQKARKLGIKLVSYQKFFN